MCVYVCVLTRVLSRVRPKTVARQSSLSLEFIQAMLMEWVAISYSRGSSRPRDQIRLSCGSCTGRQVLYHCITWEALIMILNPPPTKKNTRKEGRCGTGPDWEQVGAKLPACFSWAELKEVESQCKLTCACEASDRKDASQGWTFVATDFWKESPEFYRGWVGGTTRYLQRGSRTTNTGEITESLKCGLQELRETLPKCTLSSSAMPSKKEK